MADYGWGKEWANHGEYSGAPSTKETFVYAKTLLSLTMRYKHPEDKLLIIGGDIANFTDVAVTFTGLMWRTTAEATSGPTQRVLRHALH